MCAVQAFVAGQLNLLLHKYGWPVQITNASLHFVNNTCMRDYRNEKVTGTILVAVSPRNK